MRSCSTCTCFTASVSETRSQGFNFFFNCLKLFLTFQWFQDLCSVASWCHLRQEFLFRPDQLGNSCCKRRLYTWSNIFVHFEFINFRLPEQRLEFVSSTSLAILFIPQQFQSLPTLETFMVKLNSFHWSRFREINRLIIQTKDFFLSCKSLKWSGIRRIVCYIWSIES